MTQGVHSHPQIELCPVCRHKCADTNGLAEPLLPFCQLLWSSAVNSGSSVDVDVDWDPDVSNASRGRQFQHRRDTIWCTEAFCSAFWPCYVLPVLQDCLPAL